MIKLTSWEIHTAISYQHLLGTSASVLRIHLQTFRLYSQHQGIAKEGPVPKGMVQTGVVGQDFRRQLKVSRLYRTDIITKFSLKTGKYGPHEHKLQWYLLAVGHHCRCGAW